MFGHIIWMWQFWFTVKAAPDDSRKCGNKSAFDIVLLNLPIQMHFFFLKSLGGSGFTAWAHYCCLQLCLFLLLKLHGFMLSIASQKIHRVKAIPYITSQFSL